MSNLNIERIENMARIKNSVDNETWLEFCRVYGNHRSRLEKNIRPASMDEIYALENVSFEYALEDMYRRRAVKTARPNERIVMGYQPSPTKPAKKPFFAEKKEGYYLNDAGNVVEYSRRRPTTNSWIMLVNLFAISLNVIWPGNYAILLIIINSLAVSALILSPGHPKKNGKLLYSKEKVLFHHTAINDPISIREPVFQEAIAEYIKDQSDPEWWTKQFKELSATAVEMRKERKKEVPVVRKDYAEALKLQKQLESGLMIEE